MGTKKRRGKDLAQEKTRIRRGAEVALAKNGLSATRNQKKGGSRTAGAIGTVRAGTEGKWAPRGRGQRRAHQGGQLIQTIAIGIQSDGEGERKGQRRVHQNLTGWRRRRRRNGRKSARRRKGRRRRRRRQRKRKNGIVTVMGVKELSRKEGRGKIEKKRGAQGTEMERTGKRAQAGGERCPYLDLQSRIVCTQHHNDIILSINCAFRKK